MVKETRRHWKLKQEALDRTLWRTGFLEEALELSLGRPRDGDDDDDNDMA